ncbi:hypothetical protein LJC69_04385 [Bacteroidales bacterium OttesenSCG-928-K22]|nr:hypothetical protein [Bacteroidales bacterium OttesenSCG-928-K22]
MKSKQLILLCVTLLFSAVFFTSCNKEKKYEKEIIGIWLGMDENNYNNTSVITFDNGKAIYQNAQFLGENIGNVWYTSSAFDYYIDENILTINGKTETGIDFFTEIRIDEMTKNKASLTTIAYTLNGVSIPEQLISFNVTKVEDNSSELFGAWKMIECNCGEDEELESVFYHFKENNIVASYEKDNGEWAVYEHERYYCYGNFLGWQYKETDENSPNVFEGYTFEKKDNKVTLTGVYGDQTITIIFEKMDESELPTI